MLYTETLGRSQSTYMYEVHVCAEESAPVLMPPVFDFLENDSCPTMLNDGIHGPIVGNETVVGVFFHCKVLGVERLYFR